jgi:hypothetical protein
LVAVRAGAARSGQIILTTAVSRGWRTVGGGATFGESPDEKGRLVRQYPAISGVALGARVETFSLADWCKTRAVALRGLLRRRLRRRGPRVSNLSAQWLHTFTIESAKHRDIQ